MNEIKTEDFCTELMAIMAGIGAAKIIRSVIEEFIPKEVKLPMKLCLLVGKIVIAAVVAAAASNKVKDIAKKVDELEEKFMKKMAAKAA